MRLIVTRPQEDAEPLGRRLAAAGHEVIVAPLLSIRHIDDLAIPQRDYQAVLITSANGARALGRRAGLEPLKAATALVVGPVSAAAARAVGFARIVQADGDVAALVDCAVAHLHPGNGPLLYVSGAVTAGNLVGTLKTAGFAVDRVIAYEACPAEALPGPCAAALIAGNADGVVLFSPRSARIWTGLVRQAGLAAAALQMVHYCLSDNVAAAVRDGFGAGAVVQVPPRPEEAALLDLVGRAA